jgi:hypothetical protein
VITVPATHDQVQWCREYLEAKGGMWVSDHAQFLVWEQEGMPKWVVACDDWIGTTCQLYMACERGYYAPKDLTRMVFAHCFGAMKRSHVFGIVNSLNVRAMRLDLWLGFEEILRVPKAHNGGGDLVVLQMTPETCRWIQKESQHGLEAPKHA